MLSLLSRIGLEQTLLEKEFIFYLDFYFVIRLVLLVLPWIALLLVSDGHASKANFAYFICKLES